MTTTIRSQKNKSKFPELPPKYSTSRELRNKAEKMRRDRLNMFIDELKKLLPEIASTSEDCPPRRIDTSKTTILRLATNILKLNKTLKHEKTENTLMERMSLGGKNSHLEMLSGYFIMLSEDGKILYVSENVVRHSGYSQGDMMGHKITHFAHPEDHDKILHHLSRVKSRLPTSSDSLIEKGTRQFFHFRFADRRQSKNESQSYSYVNMMGVYRNCPNIISSRNSLDLQNLLLDTNTEYMFLGIIRPVKDRPITEVSLMEAIQDQYITRHLPDGRIVFADHRISTILGYFPSDVVGLSAFNFILGDDLPWATMAQRHMFANSKGEGFTTYHIKTKSGNNIILQSRGFLEFNSQTQKVESFLCINSVVKNEDGVEQLKRQIERFSPYIAQYKKIVNERGGGNLNDMLKWFSETSAKVSHESQNPRKRKTSESYSISSPNPSIPKKLLKIDYNNETKEILASTDRILEAPRRDTNSQFIGQMGLLHGNFKDSEMTSREEEKERFSKVISCSSSSYLVNSYVTTQGFSTLDIEQISSLSQNRVTNKENREEKEGEKKDFLSEDSLLISKD